MKSLLSFFHLHCRPLPKIEEITRKKEAAGRLRNLEPHIVESQLGMKLLQGAPYEGYAPGVFILKEHDEENAKKVVAWMIQNKVPHPSVGNWILGGNHGIHTNLKAEDHFRKEGKNLVANNFLKMRFVALRWPFPDADEFNQPVVDALYAVRHLSIVFV